MTARVMASYSLTEQFDDGPSDGEFAARYAEIVAEVRQRNVANREQQLALKGRQNCIVYAPKKVFNTSKLHF